MSLPQEELVTIEEYYKIRENSDEIIEYIDGIVYMSPSPSTKHQRISSRLHAKLFNFLENTDCEVFHAPFDIELYNDKIKGEKIVIPDLSVICDKKGLGENKYVGVPTLIIEILSPSNQSNDLVLKLNLYMKYGVEEYWIVNPMLYIVQVYRLNQEGQYYQLDALKERGTISSEALKGFSVDLEELFR
jgi:Uma2 family endonuclease